MNSPGACVVCAMPAFTAAQLTWSVTGTRTPFDRISTAENCTRRPVTVDCSGGRTRRLVTRTSLDTTVSNVSSSYSVPPYVAAARIVVTPASRARARPSAPTTATRGTLLVHATSWV